MRPALSLIGFFLLSIPLNAQSNVEIGVSYAGGFNQRDLVVWNSRISPVFFTGFDLRSAYTYRFQALPFQAVGQIGYKQLRFSADQNAEIHYSGNTQKLSLAFGGRYLIKNWNIGAYLDIENNRDFDVFRTQTSDLLRYAGVLEVLLRIKYSLGIQFAYSRALYPLQDHYLMLNPKHQFRLGINWTLL